MSGVMSFTLAFRSFSRLHTTEVSPAWQATIIIESAGTTFLSANSVRVGDMCTEKKEARLSLNSMQKALRQNKACSLTETPYDRYSGSCEQHSDPFTFAIYGNTQVDPNTLRAQEKRAAFLDSKLLSWRLCNLEASLTILNSDSKRLEYKLNICEQF